MISHHARVCKARCITLSRLYNSTSIQNAHAAVVQKVSDGEKAEDYWDTPQYPEIRDTSFKARKDMEVQTWQRSIQKVPTVEEKLIKINMPKYYGYKVVQMSEERLPYNCMPAIQHYTRTLFELGHEAKEDVEDKLLSYVNATKSHIVDALEFSHDYFM